MIKLKMEKDLTLTIKGVNYDEMRSILTAASIQHYESEKEIDAKVPTSKEDWLIEVEKENIADEKEWAKEQRTIIDSLLRMIGDEINRHNKKRSRRRN